MAKVICRRCGDSAGSTGRSATSSPMWATNPEGERVPVCVYCWSQLNAVRALRAKWDDEPTHKKMDRLGIT